MRKSLIISGFVFGCILIVSGIVIVPYFLGPFADPILQSGSFRHVRKIQGLLIFAGFLLISLSAVFREFGDRIIKQASKTLGGYDDSYNTKGSKGKAIDLFFISFLGLFMEILIIRWLSTEIRIFAYFTNLPLISCFLGLGIGFSLANRKINLYPLFPFLICALSATILFLPRQFLSHYPSQSEYLWAFGSGQFIVNLAFYLGFIFMFLFNMACFIPLGQLTGKLMQGFSPIKAYTINILGSLLGTWIFSVISFFSLSPIYWFIFGFLIMLWLFRHSRYIFLAGVFVSVAYLIILFVYQGLSIWSPYYKIDVSPLLWHGGQNDSLQYGYNLTVNQDYHQRALNLSEGFVNENAAKIPLLSNAAYAYNLPYYFVNPAKVLVVGAGTGNDIAAALRHGAEKVDAVEIDPGILNLGRKLHPEQPYQSPKVKAIVDDARSYFHKTDETYDMIVYGLLDSHTLLSSMSSVRLDNFVYTKESFQDAKSHLTDSGVIVMTFSVGREWIGQRLFNMFTEVFGKEPVAFETAYDAGVMFLAGPGLNNVDIANLPITSLGTPPIIRKYSYNSQVPNTYDDWPYLYMEKHGIPRTYWIMMILILGVSVIIILRAFPEASKLNFQFFFLGSAFLLIEVKSITQLALIFGSTWIINSIVISAILIMVLLANLYVIKVKINRLWIYYVLLILSLAVGYFVPLQSLLQMSLTARGIIASVVVSIPLFFAGIIFSTSLKKTLRIEVAFGSNLLGAMLGGFFEYASLTYGIKNLSIFAVVLYILSFISFITKRKAQ